MSSTPDPLQTSASIPDRAPFLDAVDQREALTKRLVTALSHLPVPMQIYIVASYIPLRELDKIVQFQEAHDVQPQPTETGSPEVRDGADPETPYRGDAD